MSLALEPTLIEQLRAQHEAIRVALPPAVLQFVEREIFARSMVSFGGAVRAARLELAIARDAAAIEASATS